MGGQTSVLPRFFAKLLKYLKAISEIKYLKFASVLPNFKKKHAKM